MGVDGFRALFEAGSTSLTTLTLFDNPIGNGGLKALSARFPALETLDVGATGIDDAGVRVLAFKVPSTRLWELIRNHGRRGGFAPSC